MRILLIGGTRFVGHHLAVALAGRGHRVTTFNRGQTPDELGGRFERLHGDRTHPGAFAAAFGQRTFDAAVDTIAMRGADTRGAIEALDGRIGHYVHFSTGQVYLVRDACPVPAREDDYEGALAPPPGSAWEADEWRYGVEKRECEDTLDEAFEERGFPATRLRLPMIHGERDPKGRIHAYVLRFLDGGPLLVPEEGSPLIRHVHQADVVDAVIRILESGSGKGRAYNLTPETGWTLGAFLENLAVSLGARPAVRWWPRARLAAAGLFPACSPLSNPWMSVLDGTRAHRELGLAPANLDRWLPSLITRLRNTEPPAGFAARRKQEARWAAGKDR